MVKKGKGERYIPIKNYVYAGLIFIGVLLVCWYLISWKKVRNEEKYLNSYLISTNTLVLEIKDVKEVENVLVEAPNPFFVYIGYTDDKDEYNLETNLKDIIDSYNIKDEVYYLNIKDIKDNSDLYKTLNNAFNIDNKITNVPCILYFKDNELSSIIQNKSGIFEAKEFEKLLKANNYTKEAK